MVSDYFAGEIERIMPDVSPKEIQVYVEDRCQSSQPAAVLATLTVLTWCLRRLADQLVVRLRNTEAELEKERNRT